MIDNVPGGRLREACQQHARVVLALILRDVKTRAGASYFGFLIGLIVPLAHVGILVGVYIGFGRRAAIGTDVAIYLSTAILPFVIWTYTHQKISVSFAQNKALTSFPIVKIGDILIARMAVELLNGTMVVIITTVSLTIFAQEFFINDPISLIYSLLLAYFLGVSTGHVFGLISIIFPGFLIAGLLIVPIYWITCGTLFVPDYLPEQLRFALQFFPLSHIVDLVRMAFYSNYISDFPSILYVHAVIIANVLVGLIMERFMRTALTTH